MRSYNEELVGNYVEIELGAFIKQKSDVLCTTVGETILIIQATTNYIDDLLQGLTTKEQRALVVDSTMAHTKKLMLAKVGKYEEPEKSKTNDQPNTGARRSRGKTGKNQAVHNKKRVRASPNSV